MSNVNHPAHYGGKDNPYEAIKVIEAWDLGFNLGNAVKYVSRAGKKDPAKELEDLEKAAFYLNRQIENVRLRNASSHPKTMLKASSDLLPVLEKMQAEIREKGLACGPVGPIAHGMPCDQCGGTEFRVLVGGKEACVKCEGIKA